MRAIVRRTILSVSRARRSWLTLLLLLAVLVPSACLLWFMTEAVGNERLAVRQKLVEAYRGQVAVAHDRMLARWHAWSEELDAQAASHPAPAVFAQVLGAGRADAVVVFDIQGGLAYPNRISPTPPEPDTGEWASARHLESLDPAAAAAAYAQLAERATSMDQTARALQAQARSLVRSGDRAAALAILMGRLIEERFAKATDGQNRLLQPYAQLMTLELLRESDPDSIARPLEHLRARLLDYADPDLSAAQRRFLMHELQRLFPEAAPFPTLAAEDLAARYAELAPVVPPEPGLQPAAWPGMWQFASAGARVVTLHHEEALRRRLRADLEIPGWPEDVVLDCLAPKGEEPHDTLLTVPAGRLFPGWQLAVTLRDAALFDEASNRRITTYVWTGVLVVATVLALAMLGLGLVRREAALTQLRNDLVANVTHELKTPLASMRLLVETLLEAPKLEERTAREYLELIARENLRLSRLIENFLTFSRIERNKYTFDFRVVPAASLVEQAAASAGERFHTTECRFTVELAPNLPPVRADTDAMVAALLNLLDNAWKYSGEAKEITLSAVAENRTVLYRVRDNGIGLSARDRARIFRRFYRADPRGVRSGGGCGLGLSIVRFVVEAHGGTVTVESELGRGSTFTVALPVEAG